MRNECSHVWRPWGLWQERCPECGEVRVVQQGAERRPAPRLVAEGVKVFGDEPLGYRWWLLAGSYERDEALQLAGELSADGPQEETASAYSPSGQPFYNRPWVRATRTRTLVVQRGGLDV